MYCNSMSSSLYSLSASFLMVSHTVLVVPATASHVSRNEAASHQKCTCSLAPPPPNRSGRLCWPNVPSGSPDLASGRARWQLSASPNLSGEDLAQSRGSENALPHLRQSCRVMRGGAGSLGAAQQRRSGPRKGPSKASKLGRM